MTNHLSEPDELTFRTLAIIEGTSVAEQRRRALAETNWRMPVLDPANPDDLTAIAGWLGTKAKPARASAPKPAPRGRAPVRHRTRLTDGAEHPVTVTQLPIVRCHVCQETTAVLPSSTASETLTEHYQKRHADG